MFSDYDSPVVGFSSISRSKSDAKSTETQTSEHSKTDQGIQSSELKNVGTETESLSSKQVVYDEQSLINFLKRVAPLVHEELETEADFSEIDQDGSEDECRLARLNVYEPEPCDVQQKISSLSWNSTGGTLAAAFSALRHETWCNHESQVVLHRVASQKSAQPLKFSTSSCVTCVEFHPTEPYFLLAGLYNGELRIWDLRKDNNWEIASTSGEHGMHVVGVGWCRDNTCFAAHADGIIVLQKFSTMNKSTTVLERFFVARSYLDSKLPNRDDGLDIMCLCQLSSDTLVVGTGGGGLLLCTLSPLRPPTSRPEYKDPVTEVYQPHQAVITTVRSGPSGKTFASASSNGQICVYKTNEREPRYVVNIKGCPLDIFWTDSPTVFGVCGSENIINFVTATKGEMLATCCELMSDDAATVTEVTKDKGIVAVGNACGKVETWRISLSKHSSLQT